MAVLTEEASALDELLTKATPKLNPSVRGITAGKGFKIIVANDFSAEYNTSKTFVARQTSDEIIHELVNKEIFAPA
ncbi:MAG: hypothetical protein LBV17_03135 [Treponema sp.]|jgi:hypothetical protein|nr:hypothetical protein [Treponema sp.]